MHTGRNDNIEELVSAMWQMYRDREYWKTQRNTIKNLARERFSFQNMFSSYLCEFEKVLKEIEERDWNDSHRAVAPLRQAEDAVLLDTTELNFEQSEEALLKIIEEKASV
jgi:cytidylate kinase